MGFIFIGNRLFVDFINTQVIGPSGVTDLLGTYSEWLSWLIEAKIISSSQRAHFLREVGRTRQMEKALLDVKRFRKTLRRMADVIVDGHLPDEALLKDLNKHLEYQVQKVSVKRMGKQFIRVCQIEYLEPGHLLQPIAQSVSDFLCSDDLNLLKKCENGNCILFFYDTSKNHTRRWCSMKMCGNRAKVAAHYHRHH